MKRFLSLTGAIAMLATMAFAAVTVQASETSVPTEIGVTPTNQVADGCQYASAHWTVSVGGGVSGPYLVDVNYGDGYSPPALQTNVATIPWSYTFATGCIHHVWNQTWWASRSGGGTAYDYTHVTSN